MNFKRMLSIAYNTAPILSFHEFAPDTPADIICEVCPQLETHADYAHLNFDDETMMELANHYDITLIVMGYSLSIGKVMVEVFAASHNILEGAMDDNGVWHLDDLIEIQKRGGGISDALMPYKYLSPIETLKDAKWSLGKGDQEWIT